jgi:hypothetical protein
MHTYPFSLRSGISASTGDGVNPTLEPNIGPTNKIFGFGLVIVLLTMNDRFSINFYGHIINFYLQAYNSK